MRVLAHLEGATSLPCDGCCREQAKRELVEHDLWLANVKVDELTAKLAGLQETLDMMKADMPKKNKAQPQPQQITKSHWPCSLTPALVWIAGPISWD